MFLLFSNENEDIREPLALLAKSTFSLLFKTVLKAEGFLKEVLPFELFMLFVSSLRTDFSQTDTLSKTLSVRVSVPTFEDAIGKTPVNWSGEYNSVKSLETLLSLVSL